MSKIKIVQSQNNQIPCIVGLRSRKTSTQWANYTIKDYTYPVVFTVYSLEEDILVTPDGEYLRRGYVVEINTRQADAFIVEFVDNKNQCSNVYYNANEYEYVFDPPRKITYFINFISNTLKIDYERTLSFKCPKAGSLHHNQIINNKAIQKLLLNDSNLLAVFVNGNEKQNGLFDEFLKNNKTSKLINIVNFDDINKQIHEYLREYFDEHKYVQRVIVKNAWWLSRGGSNVICVHSSDLFNGSAETKIEKILNFTSGDEENFQILIESFYEPLISGEQELYHKIRCYYQQSDECGQSQISDLYLTLGFSEVSDLDSETFCVNQKNFSGILWDKFRIKLNNDDMSQNYYTNFIDQIREVGDEFHRNLRFFFKQHNIDVDYETPMFGFDIIMTKTHSEQTGSGILSKKLILKLKCYLLF